MSLEGEQGSPSKEAAGTPSSSVPDKKMSARFDKFLLCRLMYRFHCALKARLTADTVLGRSLSDLETVTRVQREFMLYILLVLMTLSFLIGVFGRHMSNLLCVPYPTVVSLICVDSNVKQRYVKWITYWIIFGFVNLADMMCPVMSKLLPQFHLWRTLFLAWCFCPYEWNGCRVVRDALFSSRNMRILRIGSYVGYEAFRVVTVH
ncbi:receptor expression-enhancing protein 6-like [Ixodes scapularis]